MSLYLGLLSAALLCYQVLVTRVLSALLLYHYAFLVASFSVMGMGLGAMFTAFGPQLQRCYAVRASLTLGVIGVLQAVALVGSFGVFALMQLGGPTLYVIVCLPPYILGGAALALILSHRGESAGRLYAGDLLGAAVGILGTIFLLDTLGMEKAWVFPPTFALLAALVPIGGRNPIRSAAAAVMLLFFCAGFVAADGSHFFGGDWRTYRDSPHKFYGKLSGERGQNALTVVYSSWDSFSRTDVIEIEGEPDRKAVTIDGVAYSGMFRFGGEVARIGRFPDNGGYLPSIGHVPFACGANEQVLILGSGAGRDILYALYHGSTEIDAVEINRGSTAAVKHFGDFNGHLYDRPGVRLFETDGRSFAAHSTKRYDLILLTLIKTEAVGAAGLSAAEDHLLTREAFALYLAHLKDNGRLALFVHHEAALAKAAATALIALKTVGVADTAAPDHLAVFNSRKLAPVEEVYQPLLLVSRAPITDEQARALALSAESRGNLVGYLPGLREEGRLVDVKSGAVKPEDFPKDLPYYAEPATDDAPFFYRFDSTFLDLLAPAACLALVLCVFFAALSAIRKPRRVSLTLYFAAGGFGFMGVETVLAQQFSLYLGSPARAFAWVAAALLAGGTMGSRLTDSNRLPILHRHRPWAAVGVGAYLMLCQAAVRFLPAFEMEDHLLRQLVSFAILLPLGFLLGTLLPFGLKRATTLPAPAAALLLALNGGAGVLGAVLAVCGSIYLGFTWTSAIITAIYGAAFFLGAANRRLPNDL